MSIYLKLDISQYIKDKKKGSKRQLQLAKKAIEIISEEGLESLSFEVLSKKCKIARTLIYHYFPKQLDLLLFASALIRYNYQNFVIGRMQKQNTIKELLLAYIHAALEWVDAFPNESAVWIVFFQKCNTHPEIAKFNKDLVDIGHSRISEMLRAGIKSTEFKIAPEEVQQKARHIQLLITGGLISRATEFRSADYWKNEFNWIAKICIDRLEKDTQG